MELGSEGDEKEDRAKGVNCDSHVSGMTDTTKVSDPCFLVRVDKF